MRKKLFLFLLTSALLITLSGCVLSDGPLTKTNSTWSAESNEYEKLFFETQGPNAKYGFGYLVIKGVRTDEMFVKFDEQAKTMTYYPVVESENKYPEPFITFKISRSTKHWLFRFIKASDRAILTAVTNNTGDSFFDEFIIDRDKVDSSALNACNYKGIKWINDEHKITISDFKYNTTRLLKGEKVESILNKIKFEFHFTEQFRFEIIKDNQLLASGSYTCGVDSMDLTFEYNEIFGGLESFKLTAKKI